MQVDVYQKPELFMQTCGAFLRQHPLEHNLLLQVVQQAARKNGGHALFMTFSNDDGLVLAAAQEKGRKLILSRNAQGDADILPLVEKLHGQGASFGGLVGPADVVTAFTAHWTALSGQRFGGHMEQIIYALKSVRLPEDMPDGTVSPAAEKDAALLAEWMIAFTRDAMGEDLPPQTAQERVAQGIADGVFFVWRDNGRVTSCAMRVPVGDMSRIGFVYTPPEARGQGYASALVARLSRECLDAGQAGCVLYADARNPVSNSIYRKIGYAFVGRASHCTVIV